MRNIEKLRNYFLGKDPQQKETMADNSLRLIGIEGKHFVLRTELLKRLAELRKHVDDEDKELQDAIDGLIHDLSAEEAAREGADRDLQHNIDAEANTRSTNDGLLQGQLNMLTPRVADAEQDIDNLEAKSFFHVLTEDLHIPETEEVTSLTESGWYYTGEHQVYYGDSLDPAIYTQAIFYFFADSGDQWFCFLPPKMENGWDQICTYLWFDNIENKWVYDGIDIASSAAGISDQSTDNSVPTSKAVYDFVGEKVKHNYSTTEQEVGTWINGKTLYEQTIQKSVESHSLDGAAIEDVDEIFIKFGYVSDGNGAVRMLPYANGQELYVSISETLDNGARVNFDNSSTSQATFTVVVNYTKASE